MWALLSSSVDEPRLFSLFVSLTVLFSVSINRVCVSYQLRNDKGLWPENKQKAFLHLILEGDSFKTIWVFPFPSMFPLHKYGIDLACFNLSEGFIEQLDD